MNMPTLADWLAYRAEPHAVSRPMSWPAVSGDPEHNGTIDEALIDRLAGDAGPWTRIVHVAGLFAAWELGLFDRSLPPYTPPADVTVRHGAACWRGVAQVRGCRYGSTMLIGPLVPRDHDSMVFEVDLGHRHRRRVEVTRDVLRLRLRIHDGRRSCELSMRHASDPWLVPATLRGEGRPTDRRAALAVAAVMTGLVRDDVHVLHVVDDDATWALCSRVPTDPARNHDLDRLFARAANRGDAAVVAAAVAMRTLLRRGPQPGELSVPPWLEASCQSALWQIVHTPPADPADLPPFRDGADPVTLSGLLARVAVARAGRSREADLFQGTDEHGRFVMLCRGGTLLAPLALPSRRKPIWFERLPTSPSASSRPRQLTLMNRSIPVERWTLLVLPTAAVAISTHTDNCSAIGWIAYTEDPGLATRLLLAYGRPFRKVVCAHFACDTASLEALGWRTEHRDICAAPVPVMLARTLACGRPMFTARWLPLHRQRLTESGDTRG